MLPYGGTFRSCRRYVDEKAQEKFAKSGRPFRHRQEGRHHAFRARIISSSPSGAPWVAARTAMSWLQKVARAATKNGLTLEWTTPVGFRSRAEVRPRGTPRRVKTKLFGEITYLTVRENSDEVAQAKQANAMSPNFVHSLDSSAMMLTIDAALDEGITNFAMIHDSYGTLATDTERLSPAHPRGIREDVSGSMTCWRSCGQTSLTVCQRRHGETFPPYRRRATSSLRMS